MENIQAIFALQQLISDGVEFNKFAIYKILVTDLEVKFYIFQY